MPALASGLQPLTFLHHCLPAPVPSLPQFLLSENLFFPFCLFPSYSLFPPDHHRNSLLHHPASLLSPVSINLPVSSSTRPCRSVHIVPSAFFSPPPSSPLSSLASLQLCPVCQSLLQCDNQRGEETGGEKGSVRQRRRQRSRSSARIVKTKSQGRGTKTGCCFVFLWLFRCLFVALSVGVRG